MTLRHRLALRIQHLRLEHLRRRALRACIAASPEDAVTDLLGHFVQAAIRGDREAGGWVYSERCALCCEALGLDVHLVRRRVLKAWHDRPVSRATRYRRAAMGLTEIEGVCETEGVRESAA